MLGALVRCAVGSGAGTALGVATLGATAPTPGTTLGAATLGSTIALTDGIAGTTGTLGTASIGITGTPAPIICTVGTTTAVAARGVTLVRCSFVRAV